MKKIILLFIVLTSVATAQVTQQWLAVYDGPSGSIDSVRNLIVDKAGNVYVTGSSTSSTLFDYTTLKYDAAGILLWEARYDGPSHFRDDAQWVAVDNFGNVYVTGSSRSTVQAGSEDFATVKYNSNGVQQWSARYNGPAGSTDVAVKVAVDISGNVYVTGYSYGTSLDYATIKYNSAGVQQWVARYNGPGNSLDVPAGIGIDFLGNIYVTGWSRSTSLYGSEDYLTIKYDLNGAEQWTSRHNGSGNSNDVATSISIDKPGNVYVTGYCYSAETMSDFVTIRYTPSGQKMWIATYNNNGANGTDMAKMVVADNSGNVYVTGESNTLYPYGYPDYATVKYNSMGQQQWASRYNGTGNGIDVPYSIALDRIGNVYVTGKVTVPGFFSDFATVKYNSGGKQVWGKGFNGATNLHDGATSVNVDAAGNIYVAGNSAYNASYASDYVILKYTGIGTTDSEDIIVSVPEAYRLDQNYPNPFNPMTIINYALKNAGNVIIRVFDITGKEVTTLVNEDQSAGTYSVRFDGTNFPGGIYYYKLESGDFREVKKMILIK